jgi:hypothetical protein
MVTQIHFQPWVGKKYARSSRKRILVLGESHYSDLPKGVDFTRSLLDEYVRGDWNYSFWTNIGQAISGRSHWEMDRAEVWSHLAFYNYVQQIAAKGPRAAPTTSMFESSERAFFEVLSQLRPTHVVVCGLRLWRNMAPLTGREASFALKGVNYSWGGYRLGKQDIRAFPIKHPSAGFSSTKWHAVIQKFLSLP